MTSTRQQPPLRQSVGEAGFTLVEVMISIGLFGLIALAGFTLLNSELGVQARTDGRLERLGDLQRAMYVITADFEQIGPGELVTGDGTVAFSRYAPSPAGGETQVRYGLEQEVLTRTFAGVGTQRLVSGVSALRWSFYDPARGWQERWPPADAAAGARPLAVALDITLKPGEPGEAGTLRRLMALPARP